MITKTSHLKIMLLLEDILFKMPATQKDPFSCSQISQFCLQLLIIMLKGLQKS